MVLFIVDGRAGLAPQDRRIAQQRPGDGQSLSLSAGKVFAALAEDRLISLRQRHDERMRGGDLGRALDSAYAELRELLDSGTVALVDVRPMLAGAPAPIEFVNIGDRYAESGTPDELMEKYGLTTKDVTAAVKRVMGRK